MPRAATAKDGAERYIEHRYRAYEHQKAFHECTKPRRLLGGAAGPGKTLALIEDQLMHCNRFPVETAGEVHTLLLRRTHPKLLDTVITRFREKIPKEIYRDFNEQKGVVTWKNGATTKFGSMQYEHDVWGYQGQWYKIGYDELTEFTFPQWQNISAWNRCPVAKHATKDGATNPIGVGARWVEDLFVIKRPCEEMADNQRKLYDPEEYGFFAATFADNPIYANDATYIANLDSYQDGLSQALKMGIWGIAGGYFKGAWDEAYNVYDRHTVQIQPWWKKWIAGDWGFDHNTAIHWFCQDDFGIVRIYRELIVRENTVEMLADKIIENCVGADGKQETYQMFPLSHDAFAHREDTNPLGIRLGEILRKRGIVQPHRSTTDKVGREQILYDWLRARVAVGTVENPQTGLPEVAFQARLQICRQDCPNLIKTIGTAPRDQKKSEEIAKFLGDDSLQSSGYGLYAMFGGPSKKPAQVRDREEALKIADPYAKHFFVAKRQNQRLSSGAIFVPETVMPGER